MNDEKLVNVSSVEKRIRRKMDSIAKGYLAIVNDVGFLRAQAAHKGRYKTFTEYCSVEFGISNGTTYNLLGIFDKYQVEGSVPEDVLKRPLKELLLEVKESKRKEDVAADDQEQDVAADDQEQDVAADDQEHEPDSVSVEEHVFFNVPDALKWLQENPEVYEIRVKFIIK